MKNIVKESRTRYIHQSKNQDGSEHSLIWSNYARGSSINAPSLIIFPLGSNLLSQANKFEVYQIRTKKLNKFFDEMMHRYYYNHDTITDQEHRLVPLLRELQRTNISKSLIHTLSNEIQGIFEKRQMTATDLYSFLTTNVPDLTSEIAKKVIAQDVDVEQAGDSRIGGFIVYFPERMKQTLKDEYSASLEMTLQKLRNRGVEWVADGCEVRFKRIPKQNIMGLYYYISDDLVIDPASAKFFGGAGGLTNTCIHELGHRLDYYFLRKNQELHKEVNDKYLEIIETKHVQDRNVVDANLLSLSTGDEVSYTGKKKEFKNHFSDEFQPYTVEEIKNDGKTIKLGSTKLPYAKIEISARTICDWSKDFLINGKTIDCNWKQSKLIDTRDWFVSDYARTNREEWFAELFLFWVLGLVKGEPNSWITDVIKRI
jgi:hypothetical protein